MFSCTLVSGPHHGHYVTIIKARSSWMLFDDDTVTTIKESEIPKYFGDSNSGSAYVLYYQAVDLDLSALGLKPPTLHRRRQPQRMLDRSGQNRQSCNGRWERSSRLAHARRPSRARG